MLWDPTSDASMPCYSYGGPNDPCALTNTNDANDGLDKDPSGCTSGDTFFLWDEPDTQGRSYAWAATAWLGYAQAHASQLATLRQRGVRVTTPLLKADAPGEYLDEFWRVCGEASPASSPARARNLPVVDRSLFSAPGVGISAHSFTRPLPSGCGFRG